MADEPEINQRPPADIVATGGKPSPRRVAVIGVHGVAHHEPGETANAMADLLLSLPSFDPQKADTPCREREPRDFTPFDSRGIQIPLQPVCLDMRVDVERNQAVPGWLRLQEGSYKFAMYLAEEKHVGEKRGEVGRQWSVKLLQDYYGAADSNKYVTTRLEGQRASDATEVHIYEMFWADLARPANSILSFLLALFQFILHVPSLSRLAIDSRPNPDRNWKIFQTLHRYASRMLQMALPLAKLLLLIVLAVAIPAVAHVQQLGLISAVATGVLLAVLALLGINYLVKPAFKSRAGWFLSSFLLPGVVTLGLASYFLPRRSTEAGFEVVILASIIWALGAGLMLWVLDAYQNTRPGIQAWGWAAYLAALGGFGLSCYFAWNGQSTASDRIQQASFWTLQWILVSLRLSWISLALLAILSSIFGAIAWRTAGSENEKSKARAAVRTSRFAMAMPAFLFVIVTALIWAALFSVGRKISNPFFDHTKVVSKGYPPGGVAKVQKYINVFPDPEIGKNFPEDCWTPKPTCGPKGNTCTCSTQAQPDYLAGVLAWSLGPGSYIVVLITLAGLTVLIWWALPSVSTERFPPRRGRAWYRRHGTEPPRNSTNHESVWMGAWISRGLDSISLVTWLMWLASFLVPLAFMYLGPLHPHILDGLRSHSNYITKLVVCRVIAVAATSALLASLVHYSSPVLGVILDVDTYLRTGPVEATPRAKIFERYVSLLRHIARYKGADGKGYDHVVIVAHSLGALISADLLNLLQHQVNHQHETNDPGLRKFGFGGTPGAAEIPIRLFTMGNPLRQLLNRFFPYLYDWVRDNPDNGSEPLPAPITTPPTGLDSSLPAPEDLGVEKWVSAYRSGDYVGRSLWLTEWYKRTASCSDNGIYPETICKIQTGNRLEFCIGAGAHTHYWDDTAPDIAEELNDLI